MKFWYFETERKIVLQHFWVHSMFWFLFLYVCNKKNAIFAPR